MARKDGTCHVDPNSEGFKAYRAAMEGQKHEFTDTNLAKIVQQAAMAKESGQGWTHAAAA